MADELLQTLILASEKASRIARLCRENEELFSLLIQEKGQKNNEIDFKTFADVFIQQIVTKEVKTKFGKLADRVQGEENNQFTNTQGETISVEISSDIDNTVEMLSKILDGNETAAKVLAEAAHETIQPDLEAIVSSDALKDVASSGVDLQNVGLWVDPIDCTSQYVQGIEDVIPTSRGIHESGLQCVLVLFGAYCLDTGRPIMGVVNQPFCEFNGKNGLKGWSGRCVWGYSFNGVNRNNLKGNRVIQSIHSQSSKKMIVLSLHDPKAATVMDSLSSAVETCCSRGAGHKCMTVVDQLADLFIYTHDGSFKWDTCAPHAILSSCGGGMAVLNEALKLYADKPSSKDLRETLKNCQVAYNEPSAKNVRWKANSGGILVYSSTVSSWDALCKVLKAFSDVRV